MTRKAVILDSAKADFRDIKKRVKKQFGDLVWIDVNQEFKENINRIATNHLLGTQFEELGAFGCENFRKTLVRQTRIIYEFNNDLLIVHMFIHTKRDFGTHLEKRLLEP